MAPIAIDFSEMGYRVVTFSLPSDLLPGARRATLIEFSEAVGRVAKRVGPLHGIVGHSFGAAAVAMAIQNGTKTERLVLISCPFSLRHVVTGFAKAIGLSTRAHEKMYALLERLHDRTEAQLSFAPSSRNSMRNVC